MKNWSIQRRVLLIALLPAALLALVLSAYNAHQQIRAAESRTLDNARAIAAQIETIAATQLPEGDRQQVLAQLAQSVVSERLAVVSVGIRNAQGSVVARARSGTDSTTPSDLDLVEVTRRPEADTGETTSTISAGGPRVAVTVDLARVRRDQIGSLLDDLGLTALALAVTALVAVRIGRSVTAPVHALLQGLQRIRAGEYDYRPSLDAGGELGQLEHGVRELATGIDATQRSLQERIDEATRELQATLGELETRNEELEAARREAEAASEFKSRFLANISHEIRTPMNSIVGFTELLSRADLDPVHADYLATIESSAQSLLSLLNGILDLSKIESGRMELEYADTDVNALLFETFNLLAPQAFAKGVEFLAVPADRQDATVRVDAVRLKQVLINLASNAVKFTDSGHVRIGARSIPRPDGGIGLTFTFSDTGRGIPHEAQARLFQAFAQGENLRGDDRLRPTGTGLGLHIASEIVFLMDGLIEFRSEPGGGSEFWFRLELERSAAPTGATGPPPPQRHVLLIEGDPAVSAPHVEVLAGAGIRARAVGPEEPLPADVDGAELDAVLIHIPAEDAHEGRCKPASDAIRALGVPTLAYAYAQGPELHRRLLTGGFRGLVQKTPDPAGLRASLERALSDAHDRPASQAAHPVASANDPAGQREILVVDDQPLNLKLLQSYLENTVYATVAAAGSDEALYHARLRRFDAILMDIHLPERDGIETTRLLRNEGELNAKTPILAVTADAFAEQAHAGMSVGMNDVLVKPVNRTTLLDKLSEWCGPCEDEDHTPGAEPLADAGAATRDQASAQWPLFDAEDARNRAGGRDAVARELFDMLCEHLPSNREELSRACERSDREGLLTAAHRLKGAAAYCGVPRLRADLTEIEACVRDGHEASGAVRAACATIDALIESCADAPQEESPHIETGRRPR